MLGIKRSVAVGLVHMELRNVVRNKLQGLDYDAIIALNGPSIYDSIQEGVSIILDDANASYDSIMEAKHLVAKIFESKAKMEISSAYWKLSQMINC